LWRSGVVVNRVKKFAVMGVESGLTAIYGDLDRAISPPDDCGKLWKDKTCTGQYSVRTDHLVDYPNQPPICGGAMIDKN